MSNLILPNQAPRPQPGIQFAVASDGPQVVLQVIATAVLDPAAARQLMAVLEQATTAAEAFGLQLLQPQPNGTPHAHGR